MGTMKSSYTQTQSKNIDGLQHNENCFDFLRLVAALMVLLSHSYALVGMPEPRVFHYTLGGLGVCIFFVTSGYLIFQSWQRDPSPKRYLLRRSLRIFPALLVVLLLTAFVIGPLISTYSIKEYFSEPLTYRYIGNLIFIGSRALPGVFETNPYPITVNGGLWTLKYEFIMYISLLFLGLVTKRSKIALPLGLILMAICSASVAFIFNVPSEQIPPGFPWQQQIINTRLEISSIAIRVPELACYFLLGSLFSYWRKKISFHWGIVTALMFVSYFLSNSFVSIISVWALVAYGSLAFGNARSYLFSKFGKHGDFSYGIYIYGFVVQQCTSSLLGNSPNWALAFGISLIVTILLAIISWKLIEAPALKLKDRLCTIN